MKVITQARLSRGTPNQGRNTESLNAQHQNNPNDPIFTIIECSAEDIMTAEDINWFQNGGTHPELLL